MTGWLTNKKLESMREEESWPNMRYLSGICLEGLKKIVVTVVGLQAET
jgi:hypothetical protein